MMLRRGYARITVNLRVKQDLAPTGTYTWGVLRTTDTWDIENRLTGTEAKLWSFDRPTGTDNQMSYNADGLRVKKLERAACSVGIGTAVSPTTSAVRAASHDAPAP